MIFAAEVWYSKFRLKKPIQSGKDFQVYGINKNIYFSGSSKAAEDLYRWLRRCSYKVFLKPR